MAMYFTKFGQIDSIMVGHIDVLSHGFGILVFKSTESVREAMRHQLANGRASHTVNNTLVECEAVSSIEVCVKIKIAKIYLLKYHNNTRNEQPIAYLVSMQS